LFGFEKPYQNRGLNTAENPEKGTMCYVGNGPGNQTGLYGLVMPAT
jgi:hypothetical protein